MTHRTPSPKFASSSLPSHPHRGIRRAPINGLMGIWWMENAGTRGLLAGTDSINRWGWHPQCLSPVGMLQGLVKLRYDCAQLWVLVSVDMRPFYSTAKKVCRCPYKHAHVTPAYSVGRALPLHVVRVEQREDSHSANKIPIEVEILTWQHAFVSSLPHILCWF